VRRSRLQFIGELQPPRLDADRNDESFFAAEAKAPEDWRSPRPRGSPEARDPRLRLGVRQSSLDLMRICAENLSLGKTLALTPALSPRRGRAVVRLFTLCPSRLQSAASFVSFLKQYDHPTSSYRQHAGERFTLSWGERAGVRATFLSLSCLCDTAKCGGVATKGTRLCRPDQPQRLRQAEDARSKPTAWCGNVLRLVEDDTAALRSIPH